MLTIHAKYSEYHTFDAAGVRRVVVLDAAAGSEEIYTLHVSPHGRSERGIIIGDSTTHGFGQGSAHPIEKLPIFDGSNPLDSGSGIRPWKNRSGQVWYMQE